jgi:MinD-like ATPase involved in chromosome partitioning or flagellar assembly
VLQGEASLHNAVVATSVPNLSILPSGGTGWQGQAELLDTDDFASLLAGLGTRFNFVLVDSPALGDYTDAAGLAGRITRVYLVMDATRPGSENELRSLALLHDAGAVVEGVFINKIHPDYINPGKLHDLPRHIVPLGQQTNGPYRNGHAAARAEVTGRPH